MARSAITFSNSSAYSAVMCYTVNNSENSRGLDYRILKYKGRKFSIKFALIYIE